MKLLRQVLAVCALLAGTCGLGISLAQAANVPAIPKTLEQDKACTKCHDASWDKPILAVYQQRHGVKADGRTPGCQSCHGDSANHLASPSNAPDVTYTKNSKNTPEERTAACLSCHDGNKRTHWSGSQHQMRGVVCASCHDIHRPEQRVMSKATQKDVCFTCHKSQRAETHRPSTHPIQAGKVTCSDCHNPHGSAGPKLLVKNTVVETCYQCHAEKRGPFLWEHPPASDDCLNCHTPHGSTNQQLLKMRSPWLCQRCHANGAPHPGEIYSAGRLPGGVITSLVTSASTGAAATINPLTGKKVGQTNPSPQQALRGCPDCHSQIHGSNHPAGQWFAR